MIPGLPDRIEITKTQLPNAVILGSLDTREMCYEIRNNELAAYGVVVNTYEELESSYIKEFLKFRGDKVWCIGPVSCNKEFPINSREVTSFNC